MNLKRLKYFCFQFFLLNIILYHCNIAKTSYTYSAGHNKKRNIHLGNIFLQKQKKHIYNFFFIILKLKFETHIDNYVTDIEGF